MKIAHIGRVRGGDCDAREVMRVLVVEARPEFRRFARLMLGTTPYRLDEAASGEELARKLRAGSYTAILLEVRLPDLTPREVLETVRRLGGRARVLLWTTMTEPQLAELTREPVGEVLVKDCGRVGLIAAVCQVVEAQRRLLERTRTLPPSLPLSSVPPPPAA